MGTPKYIPGTEGPQNTFQEQGGKNKIKKNEQFVIVQPNLKKQSLLY